MKSVFNILWIVTTLSITNSWARPSKYMILFSGTPSSDFKSLLNRSLSRTLPEWEQLSEFESNNSECKYRKQYLIQFCLKGDQLTVVHKNDKAIKRTLSKLMVLNDKKNIEDGVKMSKAFNNEGL